LSVQAFNCPRRPDHVKKSAADPQRHAPPPVLNWNSSIDAWGKPGNHLLMFRERQSRRPGRRVENHRTLSDGVKAQIASSSRGIPNDNHCRVRGLIAGLRLEHSEY